MNGSFSAALAIDLVLCAAIVVIIVNLSRAVAP